MTQTKVHSHYARRKMHPGHSSYFALFIHSFHLQQPNSFLTDWLSMDKKKGGGGAEREKLYSSKQKLVFVKIKVTQSAHARSTHTDTHTRARTHTRTYARAHSRTPTRMHAHPHTCAPTETHVRTHTEIQAKGTTFHWVIWFSCVPDYLKIRKRSELLPDSRHTHSRFIS